MPRICFAILLFIGIPTLARAEVTSLTILKREAFAGGKSFGDVGPYEQIVGIARFAIDPKDKVIVDLALAPRNKQGVVEFEADVCILTPKDRSKSNSLLYDVNNRGNKLALRMFNYGSSSNDLSKSGVEGDGFLMKQGFTLVWSGWIGELLPGDHRMLLKAPNATDNGQPIQGLVRFEISADSRVASLPLSRRDGHGSYSPTKEGEAKGTLTKRLMEGDQRQPIPHSQWKLERLPIKAVKEGVAGTLGQVRLHLEGGFEPGYVYELICECEGPIVQGCSLASVRDLVSFLRYDRSERNPLRAKGEPTIRTTLAFGVSQSGRFLRHFLWQGFNQDQQGRIVFEGLMPHVAGGGLGFFNHRFAQPTRHNGQHEDHLYPADLFPFSYETQTDPLSKQTDGILRRYEKTSCMPRVMHTQSAAEYWHRSGSLVHTDPLGKQDAAIPANVRIYAFGGTQHGPAADPPPRGNAENLNNPADYRIFLRQHIVRLRAWCRSGEEPPPSVYPKIADGTLVDWHQENTGFPKLPGVRYPQVIQQPVFADYGPKFLAQGRIDIEPPKVLGRYVVLVPKCDRDGNDLGMLLPPEVKTPLATYTGWNLRRPGVGAKDALANLLGSYLPFERYPSFDAYRKSFAESAETLAAWTLPEDRQRAVAGREKVRGLFGR